MLSVLIPIYRQDCSELVQELYLQLREASVSFEILIGDDSCYHEDENDITFKTDIPEIKIIKNTIQYGRSKNRNMLAAKAQYQYLLFIDGDAKVIHPGFIQRYLAAADKAEVICGGTEYSKQAPKDPQKLLRWYYGKKREVRQAISRSDEPYKQFSSFNFMIRADIFKKIQFSENFKAYGHEDTFFGYELRLAQGKIKHIDNPLYHTGLDTAMNFLEKIRESVLALENLKNNNSLPDDFMGEIKLLTSYRRIKRYGLDLFLAAFFRATKRIIVKQLCSAHPQLFLLDIYKLGYLSEIAS